MERWAGKTALVTGAASGIGAGIALALSDSGLRVVALDVLPKEKIASLLKGKGNVNPVQCDLTNSQKLTETFRWIEDEFCGIDVLVNCAGVMFPGHITDVGDNAMDEDALMKTFDVNIKAVVRCTKLAIASMNKRRFSGHIFNINSLAGHYIPFVTTMNVYAATKYSITAFTESLTNELAEFGSTIKITSISPGAVSTQMGNKSHEAAGMGPARALQPSDVASALLFALATPPNVNINELTITSVGEKRM